MTSNLDSKQPGSHERSVNRSYLAHFWIGMVAYAALLIAVLIFGGLEGDSPWRFLWAVVPIIPVVWIAVAMVLHVRRIDDYQRLLTLKGLSIGFAVAMLTSATLGFLQIAGLTFEGFGAGWIVFSAGMISWAVSSIFTKR